MKKLIFILFSLQLSVLLYAQESAKPLSKAEKQQQLNELEFMKTRDPQTNTVPREKLWEAAEQLRHQQNQNENLRAGVNQ